LVPIDQCLSTPFQCIPERVGLAASTWATLAEQNLNVFMPLSHFVMSSTGPQSVSITAGQTATYNLSVASVGFFTGSVTLNCAGAPANSQCSVSPATFGLSGSTLQAVAVTVTTTPHSTSSRAIPSLPLFATVLVISGIVLGAFNKKRRLGEKIFFVLLAGMLCLFTVSCSGGTSPGASPTPNPNSGTPSGTYTITVNGNGGFSSASTNLTLVVQ
jgi:hypothetical protein